MATDEKFDLFIFGSTSEVMRRLIADHKAWFLAHVDRLIVTQRSAACPEVYEAFDPISIELDCADSHRFREQLTAIVREHATRDRPMHVFPTYGTFNWNYADDDPVFSFSDDGLQINLNARLQIIDAFAEYRDDTTVHLFGSLFANFPYTGDYALSMWYVNQLPRNAEYRDRRLKIYNLGGMKTRFWRYQDGPKNNPFLHDDIPTDRIMRAAFGKAERGVFTFYPSFMARVACFLGARGVRVL